MLMTIPILEEALGVKSVSGKPFSEGTEDNLNNSSLVSGWVTTAVEGLSTNIIETSINSFLEIFLCEYLINSITEIFPTNMASFLWCTEVLD